MREARHFLKRFLTLSKSGQTSRGSLEVPLLQIRTGRLTVVHFRCRVIAAAAAGNGRIS